MLRRLAVTVILAAVILAGLWVWWRPLPPYAEAADQPAQFLSSYTWVRDEDWFGGFSGLEVATDGRRFYAVNDRGHIVTAILDRTGDSITGVTLETANLLNDDDGLPVINPRTDAEGLARAPDGRLVVSFERVHRVWIYTDPDATAEWASYMPGWRALATNGGMEALAIADDGTLWTVAESTGKGADATLVYTRAPGQKWQQPYVLPLEERFLPVGADFGPDGRLYLLERDVYPFGFRSRIRALTIGERKITASETLLHTALGRHGNLEGLAVWQDADGRTRLTMIADDNFLPVQTTQIVEYILPQGPRQ